MVNDNMLVGTAYYQDPTLIVPDNISLIDSGFRKTLTVASGAFDEMFPYVGYSDFGTWSNIDIKPSSNYTLSFFAKTDPGQVVYTFSYLYPEAV